MATITLESFQLDAVNIMYNNALKGHGSLLADEMGLGKTIQLLALIKKLMENDKEEKEPLDNLKYLIIVPKSLVDVWNSEKNKLDKEFFKGKVHICNSKLEDIKTILKTSPQILITKPSLIRQSGWDYIQSIYGKKTKSQKKIKVDSKIPWFYQKKWKAIIIDEAHEFLGNAYKLNKKGLIVKNWTTKVPHCLMYLKHDLGYVVTGTPIRNSISDIIALSDFVTNKITHQDWNTNLPNTLQTFKDNYMIRRNDNILNLPTFYRNVIDCKMSDLQTKTTLTIMRNSLDMFQRLEEAQGLEKGEIYIAIMGMINRLRVNNCSPYLLSDEKGGRPITTRSGRVSSFTKSKDDLEVLKEEFDCEIKETNVLSTIPNGILSEVVKNSPKILKTLEMISILLSDDQKRIEAFRSQYIPNYKMKPGNPIKVLIFSFSVETLKLIDRALIKVPQSVYDKESKNDKPLFDTSPMIFKGDTTVLKRKQYQETFQTDEKTLENRVMLLSCKAGGLGITLTRATDVILLDPWWHPFTELQAGKRIHRKGQTQECFMWRLLFNQEEESIDKWIVGLQKQKLEEAKKAVPDIERFTDCFIGSKMNLVENFSSWVENCCIKYGVEVPERIKDKKASLKGSSSGKKRSREDDTNKPSQKKSKSNWTCGFCSNVNKLITSICSMCDCPREGGKPPLTPVI